MNITTQAGERGTAVATIASSQFNRTAAGAAALGAVFTLPVAVDAAIVYVPGPAVVATLPVSQRHASNNTNGGDFTTGVVDIDGNGAPDVAIRVGQVRGTDTFESTYAFANGQAQLQALGPGALIAAADGFSNADAINFGGTLAPSNSIGPINGGEGGAGNGAGQVQLRNAFDNFSLSGSPGSPATSGSFANGVAGVAGVKFFRAETGQNHYGWVRLLVEDGGAGFPYQVTALDWAWETNPETPFHYANPEIPEANPGLILLAAGGTGLAAWRLRRRQAAQAAAQA